MEVIKSDGYINFSNHLCNKRGTRIANDFLNQLIKGFAKQCSLYIRATGEAPFVFRERQLHSILAPALSKITDAFLMEAPVLREWSSISSAEYNDSYGWVDYWCKYRDTVFFIELKHNFLSSRTGQITKGIMESWQAALDQLDVIERTVKEYSINSKGTLKIGMHILPLYETVNVGKPKNVGDLDSIIEIQRTIMNRLERKPNWSALWVLHKDLVGPYKYTNTVEYYPGILFIVNVSELIK